MKIEGLAAELNGFIEKRLALAAEVMNVDKQLLQKSDELKIEIRPFVKSQHVRDSCTTASSTSAVRTFERWRRSWSRKMTTSVPTRVQWRSSLQELLGNAIYLNYDLMLGSDSVSIMSSHSKRALTLRRVIIELDASEYPIILDQSEDDLDNPSIYDGLATYLNSKKSRFARSSWSRTAQTPWSAVTSST